MHFEADDIASIDSAFVCGPMHGRPLVALLDGRDCSVEMPIRLYLRGISARDLDHVLEYIYKGSLNCASFAAGIIDAALDGCNLLRAPNSIVNYSAADAVLLCDVCKPGDEIELTGVYTHNY